MTHKPRSRAEKPDPAHPTRRDQPLPWTDPKPVNDDPRSSELVAAILNSPEYREADRDTDFLGSDAARGIRLQLDFQKCESLLQAHGIRHSIVVFGSKTKSSHTSVSDLRNLGQETNAQG